MEIDLVTLVSPQQETLQYKEVQFIIQQEKITRRLVMVLETEQVLSVLGTVS
jgi:hypothetical protein